jgi:glucose/arabinose dehydrogenase
MPYRVSDSRFLVESVANFSQGVFDSEKGAYPICVAVDEQDHIFVSVQCGGMEDYAGKIVQIIDNSAAGGSFQLKTVADDNCLWRTFGLAVRRGQLFVSRSGFFGRAKDGRVEYENSGVITRLSDLDRDGMMDYYEDVVIGLPGCQGPVPQHSNNGIAFGPDGSLYIAQGVHSDRSPLSHPWEGTVLRASPDFKNVSVFARGLRNPFGLVFGINQQLFATDNDVTIGNPGDELNVIKEGSHYGHPFVIGNSDGGGHFVRPILVWQQGSLAGVAYSDSVTLPKEYRGCLYVADYSGCRILRVVVNQDSIGYSANAMQFAELPWPVGIAATRTGVLYVTSLNGKVYRIRQIDPKPLAE